jgi:hypothetical protein
MLDTGYRQSLAVLQPLALSLVAARQHSKHESNAAGSGVSLGGVAMHCTRSWALWAVLALSVGACAKHGVKPASSAPAAGTSAGAAGSTAGNGAGHGGAGSMLDAATGHDAALDAQAQRDAAVAADGGMLVGHTDAGVDPLCAGLPGRCVKVCEGGNCSCSCTCASKTECSGPSVCVAPVDPTPPCCGVAPMCQADSDCASKPGGSTTPICNRLGCGFCTSACTKDLECGDGYRCRSDGHCTHARCDQDGVACPAQSHCAAAQAQADSFGCLHDACSTDAECNGACVNGHCYASGGRCAPTLCP